MRFWSREITGWFLIGVGLCTFFLCYESLLRGQVVSAGPMTIIGIFIFRGGIHLVKVALAARVCVESQPHLKENRAAATAPVMSNRRRLPTASGRRTFS